ncbi:MAG TPA: cytochrome c [Candidatus Baltobacteraceae bacterium]|nr:cytochrome c [Candidatus Baltobacteraceae bacterium]
MNRFAGIFVVSLLAVSLASGCTKTSSSSQASATPTSATTGPITDLGSTGLKDTGTATLAPVLKGDPAKGKVVFAQSCAGCHGANAQGGVGPDLHGKLTNPVMERTSQALEAWIKDPKPPMSKLYPASLNDQDVADVAAYLKSL